MEYRHFGHTGLIVSRLCLGTMTFGDQVDFDEALKIVDAAIESGINFIDTADGYSKGVSEEIVGKAIAGRRHRTVLATKGGQRIGESPNDAGLSRKHLMDAVEGSLGRLGTDYLDIYYVHVPDPQTPCEETLRALDDLVRTGKVRYIACSNFSAWRLCQALYTSRIHGLAEYAAVQTPYNLLTRDVQYELLPFCASENVGVCVYNPLAAGLLTGKHDPTREPLQGTRFTLTRLGDIYRKRYWSANNFEAISRLKEAAAMQGHSLAQFSLAWILRNDVVTSVILGVSRLEQLKHNLDADGISLSEVQLRACDEVWDFLRPPQFFYER